MRWLALFVAFWPLLVAANTAELKQTAVDLKAQQAKAKALKEESAKIASELAELNQQSAAIVASVRGQQDRIESNRAELKRLSQARLVKEAELKDRESEIARLLHGMLRLQRMPRQYAIAQPADMPTLLRTASALNITYGAGAGAMAALRKEYQALEVLDGELQASQKALGEKLAAVKAEQNQLKATITARRKLQQRVRRDQAKVNQRVRVLSAKSSDLQELIARLESETMLFKQLGAPQAKPNVPKQTGAKRFAARKGALSYPAAGRVLHRYGDKREPEGTYRGVELATPAEAPVTAPHGGKIVFSGEFMDYGPMVIIQHDKAYHSVIAGLDVVAVEPGQRVAEGGLIGTMGASAAARTLYYELRKHSKAIDPASWMGNVSLAARRSDGSAHN